MYMMFFPTQVPLWLFQNECNWKNHLQDYVWTRALHNFDFKYPYPKLMRSMIDYLVKKLPHTRFKERLLPYRLILQITKEISFSESTLKFRFHKVPFGLAKAPAYFQCSINKVSNGLKFAFRYQVDILIYSPYLETHIQHLV